MYSFLSDTNITLIDEICKQVYELLLVEKKGMTTIHLVFMTVSVPVRVIFLPEGVVTFKNHRYTPCDTELPLAEPSQNSL
jgi:hypothetical protein